ncbi:MAG: glyoxylase-like metal-dependent hydrolase (beta-lactamase superfamily II) [Cellvibrionaceae bacterium]
MELPTEFTFVQRSWLNCNSILIQGDGPPALVDSGHLLWQDETLELIRLAGVEPETLGQIATTHCHCDHHGANKRLKALSGATIGMGPLTAEWFATGEKHLTWFEQLSQDADVQPADIIYNDGDTIHLSGMPFEVMTLPGHAPDCIGFYQPDTRVLICADAMWENDLGVLHTAVHGTGVLDDAEAAVRKIMTLDPLIAIPGHGGLITNVAENGANILRRLDSFRQEPGRLAWHITRRFTMYSLLTFQPTNRHTHIQRMTKDNWIYHYLDLLNVGQERQFKPAEVDQLISQIIDEFIGRGLVVEKNNQLTCTLPK